MRIQFYVLLLLVLFLSPALVLHAQPNLGGSIGLDAMPDDNEGICTHPMFQVTNPADFNSTGLPEGVAIPDFTFYTMDSVPVTASKLLATGKPLVLISASYTCDVFRNQIPQINQLVTNYGNAVSIYLVYTIEAHPIVDTCVYVSRNWVVRQDSTDHVLYREPKTYGERKALIDTMLRRQTDPAIKAPIIIDGPCNDWWRTFGHAPNCAYLIDPNGKVVTYQGWFNDSQSPSPTYLFQAIDKLLGNASVQQTEPTPASVWPNPVPMGSMLHVTQMSSNARFILSDVLGRSVLAEGVNADGSVSLQSTAPGAYYYRLETGGSVTAGRLIVSP
ncbi:MAG: T9SS type A sorting domain-containing protein [Bacteroidota bacterium]|nr:T9SS type A sorting domain-containing protein [Bacteroidota bacterium]MDP4233933.1 T9SS type A sorting domain-containing protein [Bacteroidota bacterium]MDP4242816.1 T9SS type A sorting domain-containing protein [Bacteroidota bacterium]MDP4288294.1 T9SS type A sorting domain-containing protein [Bacteroidota bacterium]